MSDRTYELFAQDADEADRRAEEWKDRDPFKRIQPTLLSGEHIEAYIRQTAMLHPIDLRQKGALKGASCEIMPGEHFYRWDDGKKIITKLSDAKEIIIPANSIVFVQIASRIRLPNYIAIRFNLRIAHVHRGLLLGTGPLVDPAFKGDLLIPLHNLTASEYRIPANTGLIWVEFTKTSRRKDDDADLEPAPGNNKIFRPSDKDLPSVEFYFEKANKNRPIESSIPGEIRSAKKDAAKALATAKVAKRTNQIFASIGFLAVLGALVGLVSFLQTANQRVDGLNARLDSATKVGADATAVAAVLRIDLERALAELRRERDTAADRDRALATLRQMVDGLVQRGGAARPDKHRP